MENLDVQLKSLQHKLQLLLKQNQSLLKQNKALQKETETLRQTLQEKAELTQQMQQQIDVLKISDSGLTEDEKKILEKKIDSYLTEIERCITLLNE